MHVKQSIIIEVTKEKLINLLNWDTFSVNNALVLRYTHRKRFQKHADLFIIRIILAII